MSEPENPWKLLTSREAGVAKLLAEGYSAKEVAKLLAIETKTAETHRANILRKLNATSTLMAIRKLYFFASLDEERTIRNPSRLWDLVRYMRAELLAKALIDQDEYALLAEDHAAVRRLEADDARREAPYAFTERPAAKKRSGSFDGSPDWGSEV